MNEASGCFVELTITETEYKSKFRECGNVENYPTEYKCE